MRPLDAILFDMGGTLDGRGGWRDRFERLFVDVGLDHFTRAERKAAFDYAGARSQTEGEMASACLRLMVTRHVDWQLEHLAVRDAAVADALVDRFVATVESVAAIHRQVLAAFVERGWRIGVVSNACGNCAALCDELGYTPMLSVVIDSHRVGVSKPDPGIFLHALNALKVAPERAAMVGDSCDHDIVPARALGLFTVWVSDARPAPAANVTIARLDDLPALMLGELRPA